MKKKIIRILLVLFTLAFLYVVYAAYQFYVRLNWFSLEDNISHRYAEVVEAVDKFKSEKDRYPETLNELKPDYMSALPSMPEVTKFSYSISSDKTVYRIILRAKSKGIEREFVHSSDGKLTKVEKSRSYTGCHGWEILRVR